MKKLLVVSLVAALTIGCAGVDCPVTNEAGWAETGGAVCQGSRAWKEHNVCGQGNTSGTCIRVVEGPYVLTAVHTCERCTHPIKASIGDTYGTQDERLHPRWEVGGDIHNVNIVINAGESLFLGTDGFNDVVNSSCCYTTWTGHRPDPVK